MIYWRNGVADIIDMAVDHGYQRRGIGRYLLLTGLRRLLKFSCRTIDCVFLEVGVENEAAIALYRSLGFQKQCIRKRYDVTSESVEDAWVMCLSRDALIQ